MKKKFTKQQLWVLLGASLFQCALIGILTNSTGVLLTQIRADTGLSMTQISLHNTIRSVMGALGGTFFASVFFKIDKAKCMLGTILIMVTGYLLLIIGTDSWLWYVIPLLLSPTTCIGVIAVPYILNDWFPGNVGFATGFALAFSGLGGVVFNPVAAFLINSFGWQTAIVILGATTIVMAVVGVSLVFREAPPETGRNEKEILWEDGTKDVPEDLPVDLVKKFVLCSLCLLGGSICTQLVNYVSLYTESVGYSLSVGAMLTSLVMIGNIGGKLVFGIACDMMGVWNAMAVGLICVFLGTLGLVYAAGWLPVLCISALLFGITYATYTVAISRCCIRAYGAVQSERFSGPHTSISSATGALCSFGAGVLFDRMHSFAPIFLVGAACCLVSIAASLILGWEERKERTAGTAQK